MPVPTRNGVQYSSVNGAGTLTANYPAGSSSGDLVILQVRLSANSTTARTVSVGGGGWTNIITNANAADGTWTYVWWKFRGAETSAVITPSISTDQRGMGAEVISYAGSSVDSSSPCAPSNVTYQQPAATSIAGTSVTTTTADCQVLHLASGLWVGGAVSTTWSGVTEIDDNSSAFTLNGVTFVMSVAYEDMPTAGATTARTATFSQSMFQRTQTTIAVRPNPLLGADVGPTFTENASKNIDIPAPGPEQIGVSNASGTGFNLVIDYPAGSVSGDYVVALAHFYKTTGTTAPAIGTPTGWTLLETQAAGGTDPYRVGLYGRFRGAETSVTFTADTGTNVQSIGAAYAYRNVDAGVPVTDSAISYALDTDNTFAVPSVTTTSGQNRLLKAYISNGQYQSEPGSLWASSYEASDVAVTIDATRRVNLSTALGYQETAGATGTETVTQIAPLVAITPLGMQWSGSWDPADNTTTKRTGMTPQAGTASGDIVNDALIVNGAGNVTVTASASASSSSNCTLRIFLNGVEVASGTATSATWTGDVVQGDALDVRVNKGTSLTRSYQSVSLSYTVNGSWQLFASDDFDGTGALNSSNWTTDGGGTIKRTSGEMDGDDTPSVPLSFAWWNVPASSGAQKVTCRVRWNGRTSEHSSVGPVVRADPFQSPAVNPGAEHGVLASAGGNFEALYYEDFDQSDTSAGLTFNGLKFVTGSGGFTRPIPQYPSTPLPQYPENALLELESNGNTYTYTVNGVVHKTGTVSTSIIPETYLRVGLMMQNDELETGGGTAPPRLDEFRAYNMVAGGSGTAHTFAVTVALQVPQDIQLSGSDTGTATDNVTSTVVTTTATTDTGTGADNATNIAQPDSDPVTLLATETVTSQTATLSGSDTGIGVTESVPTQTATLSGDDTGIGSAEDASVSNSVLGEDTAAGFWTYPSGVNYRQTVLDDSPVAYFPLDEADSFAVDLVNGVHADQTNGATGTRAADYPEESARDFTGASLTVSAADATDIAWFGGDYSVEWWSIADSLGQNTIMSQRVSASDVQGVSIFNGTAGATVMATDMGSSGTRRTFDGHTMPTDVWVHYVYTFEESTGMRRLYVDGALVDAEETVSNTPPAAGTAPVSIGMLGGNASYVWDGGIAHMSMYRALLTPEQVQTHYEAGTGGSAGGTAASVAMTADSDTYSGFVEHGVPAGEDTATGTDNATGIAQTDSDTGFTAVETENVSNAVAGTDAGSAADGDATLSQTATGDTGTAADGTATLAASIPVSDTNGPTSETFSIAMTADTDTNGATSETVNIAQSAASDAVTLTADEASGVGGNWVVSDEIHTSDDHVDVAMPSTDTVGLQGTDLAYRSSDGVLDVQRLTTVLPESRRYRVDAEDRWITVEPERRSLRIGAQNDTVRL